MGATVLNQLMPFALALRIFLSLGELFAPHEAVSHGPATVPPIESTQGIACFDTIRITLNSHCQFLVTADMVMEGSLGCLKPEDLIIVVGDHNPANGPVVDLAGSYKFVVALKEPSSCSSFVECSGVIIAEDKSGPFIETAPDATLAWYCDGLQRVLNNPKSQKWTGYAIYYDNCSRWVRDTVRTFKDEVWKETCDSLVIRRTYTAADKLGNTSSASQLITLVRPPLDSVLIDTLFLLDAGCAKNKSFPLDKNGNVHPMITGYPYVHNVGIPERYPLVKDSTCGFTLAYEDTRFDICPAAYKLVRKWTVWDWCRKSKRVLEQVIKIGDVVAPEVKLPYGNDTLQVSTSPFACTGIMDVRAPIVVDSCSAFEWSAELKSGSKSLGAVQSKDRSRLIANIPMGCHTLIYTVRDECHNTTQVKITVCIVDKISPIAICDDQINVSLGGDGVAFLRAVDVNEGSRDNCELRKLEVRRILTFNPSDCKTLNKPDTTAWSDHVAFYCCEAGQQVKVELRAIDAAGNINTCWSSVLVEDKVAPWCKSPKDTAVFCDLLPPGVDIQDSTKLRTWFGLPEYGDNCQAELIEYRPRVKINNCGVGFIERSFRVRDRAGNWSPEVCTQTITLKARHNYAIKFPKDYTEFCKTPEPDTVFWDEIGCDVLAINIYDKKYQGDGKDCYRIHRTFEVINWCEYKEGAPAVIVGRDEDCDGIEGNNDIWVLRRPDATVYYDADNNENNTTPRLNLRTCGGNPAGYWKNSITDPAIKSTGLWRYTQVIRVQDNVPPVIAVEKDLVFCATRSDCKAEVFISAGIFENCGKDNIRVITETKLEITERVTTGERNWRVIGRYPKYLFTGVVPIGEYEVEIKAIDECGNIGREIVRFKVVDCKPPALVCINGLSAELSKVPPRTDADGDGDFDQAAAVVWAKDMVVSAYDSCSGPVTLSINRKGEKPDIKKTAITLTCDDIGNTQVEIHAWDNGKNPNNSNGPNHDFCETFIIVQDNKYKWCDSEPDTLIIQGQVRTDAGLELQGVQISTSGELAKTATTGAGGRYQLNRLNAGYDYSIVANKTGDGNAGVSTLDLVLIQKHILGNKPLEKPYQLIAADVNGSGTITTLDLISIRKVILNLDVAFIGNQSWRFVDAKHTFSNPQNPWASPLPQSIQFNNLVDPKSGVDFMAIKLGDVNGSLVQEGSGALRSQQPSWDLQVPLMNLEAGKEYELPLTVAQVAQLEGLQFGLKFDPKQVEVLELIPGLARVEHWNATQLGSGELRLSWNKVAGMNMDEPLLVLRVRPRTRVLSTEFFQLSPRVLAPEAYVAQNEQVHRLVVKGISEQGFQFFAPTPNPFQEQTRIAWTLAHAEACQMTVLNLQGQVLKQWKIAGVQGYNTFDLKATDFGSDGLFLVRLESASGQRAGAKVMLSQARN
jgi:hypothetical protein